MGSGDGVGGLGGRFWGEGKRGRRKGRVDGRGRILGRRKMRKSRGGGRSRRGEGGRGRGWGLGLEVDVGVGVEVEVGIRLMVVGRGSRGGCGRRRGGIRDGRLRWRVLRRRLSGYFGAFCIGREVQLKGLWNNWDFSGVVAW